MRTFFLSALAAIITSFWGWHFAEALVSTITVIPGLLSFTLHHNAGVAFGINLPDQFEMLTIHLALALVIIMAVRSDRDRIRDIGFGLIAGGAISNILDRAPDGVVTDFISIGTFPIFNIPDVCITIGVLLLLVEGLRKAGLKE